MEDEVYVATAEDEDETDYSDDMDNSVGLDSEVCFFFWIFF